MPNLFVAGRHSPLEIVILKNGNPFAAEADCGPGQKNGGLLGDGHRFQAETQAWIRGGCFGCPREWHRCSSRFEARCSRGWSTAKTERHLFFKS